MVFVVLVVLVVVAGTAVVGGTWLVGTGRLRVLAVPVAAVAGVVVLLAAALLVGGLRDGSDDSPEARTAPTPVPSRPVPRSVAADLRLLVMAATDARSVPHYPVVAGLPPEGVVRVVATGFLEFDRGEAAQCLLEPPAPAVCTPLTPVQFDGAGRADFQVLVSETVDPGRCRVGRPTCLLRIVGEDGREAAVQTVFVDGALPARVTLGVAVVVDRGHQVEVKAGGLAPGTRGVALVCGAACAPAEPEAVFVAGPDGAGRALIHLGGDPRCGPRRPCSVAVFVDDGFLIGTAGPVRFPAGARPSYDPGRLAAGLGLALVLAAAAVLLAARTDWAKPTEAGAAALETADLQAGASLDELFGTDAEIDQRDPISSA